MATRRRPGWAGRKVFLSQAGSLWKCSRRGEWALNRWFSTNLEKASGFCSLALDSKQRPHISYPAGTGVIHSYWDGEKWQKQFANVHARVINYYTSIALDRSEERRVGKEC